MKRSTVTGALLVVLGLLASPGSVAAQQPATVSQPGNPTGQTTGDASQPPPGIDDTITAGEADDEEPARRLVRFNEYAGRIGSIRVGFNFMYEYAAFSQDANSVEQVDDLDPDSKLRDFRVLFGGRLNFKRPTTWSTGIMYDAANDEWVARQTGFMVDVPEIWGQIFVGRTKEGFSMNKVMVGTAGWGMERAPISDATIPILADGVKWLGYRPKQRILWNLGFYGDALSEGQGFSTYSNQLSGRFAWLPVRSEDGETLLHVGVSGRYGKPDDGVLRLRARSGAYPGPYFMDTGEFAANSTTMTGLEIYYRPGRFTFGSEYFMQSVDAPDSGNPFFHGGEVFMAWVITGETRSYNTRGGYFNAVSPASSIYSGGRGAWEAVSGFTYTDLDDGTLSGGKYWRFTETLNWHLSDNARLEFAYGYGSLDRFGLVGKTHFFQTRFQFLL